MLPPTKRYIGADIQDASIRLIEVSKHKKHCQFHHYFTGSSEALFAFSSFKTKNVVLAIPDTQILTKKIVIGTKLSLKEKREYLAFEMEKLALCSRKELFFDFRVLKKLGNHREEVLCATVRREIMDSYRNIFKNSSLKIKKILMNSEVEYDASLEVFPDGYQKAGAVAISGFKSEAFNFIPIDKKGNKSSNFKLIVLIFLMVINVFLFFHFNHRTIIKPKRQKVINKISAPSVEYGTTLKDASIDQLKMLGKIKTEGLMWGIIQSPDGAISHIKKGEKIGFEQARVVEILPNKVILLNHKRRYVIE